jgi:hypothetical protein
MAPRLLAAIAVAASFVLGLLPSRVDAACPSLVLVYGELLERPILLDDCWANVRMFEATKPPAGPTTTPASPDNRPTLHLAFFWNSSYRAEFTPKPGEPPSAEMAFKSLSLAEQRGTLRLGIPVSDPRNPHQNPSLSIENSAPFGVISARREGDLTGADVAYLAGAGVPVFSRSGAVENANTDSLGFWPGLTIGLGAGIAGTAGAFGIVAIAMRRQRKAGHLTP